MILLITNNVLSQNSTESDTLKSYKKPIIIGSLIYSTSIIGLNQLWYSDYDRSSFHTFNDNSEWLQMDKLGHAYSAYALTSLSYQLVNNGTLSDKDLLFAGASSMIFLTSIEVLDGFSSEWGFSWGDMIANTSGVGLFIVQEKLFQNQVLRLKYSYHNTEYRELRPDVLGENTLQGIFKDYNGQTYWASLNLNSIYSPIKPKWVNFAFGYSGEQMVYANQEGENNLYDPYRQYLLSLDIDFEKIETNKIWLKTVFKVANFIKIPFPAIEFKSNNETKYHWLYF